MKHRVGAEKSSIYSHLAVLSVVLLMLLVGIMGQISLWALMFSLLGEFEQFSISFYHSTVNFGSLGYGDIVMSDKHRLLGALEAINGVLMIGISTAALSTPFKDVLKSRLALK